MDHIGSESVDINSITTYISRMEKLIKENLADSISYADLCRRIGSKTHGGAYRKVRNLVLKLGLDTSHFDPFQRKGTQDKRKLSLDDLLFDGRWFNPWRLKKKLIEANIMTDECIECGIGPEYNGKPITLELDHINGKSDDNRIENLRILCPNCHSQTDTYRSKKIG